MSTTTANLGLTLPTPNVDTGWGFTLNTDFTLVDNLFTAAGTGTSVGLNVGTGKTLGIGGTLLLGSGDGTGTTTAPTIRGAARTGTNVVGATLVIDAPNGTGTGGSGAFVFRAAPAGASGSTANTMQNAVIIYNNGSVTVAGALETGGYIAAAEYVNAVGAGGRITFNATTAAAYSTPIALVKGLLTDGNAAFSGDLGFYTSLGAAYTLRMRLNYAGALSFTDGSTGSSGQVLQSNGGSPPSWSNPAIGQIGAQTFAAGGNSFFGIPAWAKSIIMTVGYMDKSSSTTDVLVRIGTSAGFVAAGYVSSGSAVTATAASSVNNTTGFLINIGNSIGSGTIRLNLVAGNSWVCDHTIGATTAKSCFGGGLLALPGVLDRIQIIPITGTFAINGAVNVFYE
jgi:hypothetical protein